ncbi:hypothetical protein STENM223S_09702 [Streptomyces tendae]
MLNATTRSGLAQKTADELKKRGFRVGEVSNAPKEYDKKVGGTGLLLGPDATLERSLTGARHPAVRRRAPHRRGPQGCRAST